MRIVSLAPSNTEILYALGCGDEIVACTRYCDYPANALQKPRIGGWLDINDQLVMRHKPDVVMTSTFVQDKVAAHFKEKGVQLFHTDPKTLNDVFESIISIGKFVDREHAANDLVFAMKRDLEKIRGKTHALPNIKVYCEEWHKPPTVSGNWVPKIIEIAGGLSLCPEGGVSRPVSEKEVAGFDPDCMVLSICGMGTKAKPELITEREGWQSLRAVKEGKVMVMDDSLLNRPGPRLIDGAKALAGIIRTLG